MLEAGGSGSTAAPASGAQSTLGNLSAYLTLLCSEKAGFEPSKLAMSEADAADLAGRFASFDLNDDGRLDAAEVRAMAGQLGVELSEADARAAIQVRVRGGCGFVLGVGGGGGLKREEGVRSSRLALPVRLFLKTYPSLSHYTYGRRWTPTATG
jgi:hypothetical protein